MVGRKRSQVGGGVCHDRWSGRGKEVLKQGPRRRKGASSEAGVCVGGEGSVFMDIWGKNILGLWNLPGVGLCLACLRKGKEAGVGEGE